MSYTLTLQDVDDIATGAGILGTGGGGDPFIGRLLVQNAIRSGLRIDVIDPEELSDDSFVVSTAMMGAPSVVVEKIPAGDETVASLRALERHLGKSADYTIPMECGGLNSMIPLLVAAQAGIPVVDGDGMGRAFPELQMETFGVYGINGSPMAVTASGGDHVIVDTGPDNKRMEDFARAATIQMGGAAYIAEYPMSGADCKRTAIRGTLTLARDIGRAVRTAHEKHMDPFEALVRVCEASLYSRAGVIASGKIVDLERDVVGGFTAGRLTIDVQSWGQTPRDRHKDDGSTIEIEFRNENVVARDGARTLALVPDLICILDSDTATAITTEALRYGQRVTVVGISTPEIMRSPQALEVWGPRCFGVNEDWTPIEDLVLR